jgi:hypothetical protein
MELSFGGSAGEMSELLVACRAGDTPPQTGHLPLHRVYSRADLKDLHKWALSSVWRGYLEPRQPRNEIAAGKPGGFVSLQQCMTASELARATIGKEDELVCFGGRFSEESVLRFHRDRRATLEQLDGEASIEKHMPSRERAAKLREGALSRGVRLVITDGHTDAGECCVPTNPSVEHSSTGSVVIAVHHQSKDIFHTTVQKDQCYVLTALRRAGEEETSEALEPVLHTTAATTLTPVDVPSCEPFWESSSTPTTRALTVLDVINGHAARPTGALVSSRCPERNCTRQKLSAPATTVDASVPPQSFPPIACNTSGDEKQIGAHEIDDGNNDEDEQTQTLSLDSAILDSASDLEGDESSELRGSEASDTIQMLGDEHDTTANCVDDTSSSRAAVKTRRASDRARLRCTAYVRSIDLEAFIPAAESLGRDCRTANMSSASTSGRAHAGADTDVDADADADANADADAGWLSLLRWRCVRLDCSRQLPLTSSSRGEPVRGTRSCDRCGGILKLSLRDMTMVLSDCPQDCEDSHGCTGKALARSETLTVAVLPCAIPSLFCGLVTPERVYGDSEIPPHSDNHDRAQVREAIWALCNSGTRLTFELEYTQPKAGGTDSQGYGIEAGKAATIASYAVAAIDWNTAFPLDWSCGCTRWNSAQGAHA